MKKIIALYLITLFIPLAKAQQTNTKYFDFGGQTRSYIEYIPATYSNSNSTPLLLSLHGMGDNANNFQYNGLKLVADTAGFILVYPNAAVNTNPFINATFWNADLDASYQTNDVGFLNALIDTISKNYNIDTNRVFSSGFSSGAFMTQKMGCESSKIKGIVPVAGTLSTLLIDNCIPANALPILHIHGTTDNVVPWAGSPTLNIEPVDTMLKHWAAINGCTITDTTHIKINNSNVDGYTFERYTYNNCTDAEIQLIKGNNVAHTWIYKPLNDIDYATEIWKFLMNIKPKTTLTQIELQTLNDAQISIFPNPSTSSININLPNSENNINIYSISGKLIYQTKTNSNQLSLDTSLFESGIYYITTTTSEKSYSAKFIITE